MPNISIKAQVEKFIVVIVGVLIAFQLNTCARDHSQDALVKTHMEAIIEETKANQKSMEDALSYGESQARKLDTLLQLMVAEEDLPRINRLCLDMLNISGAYIRKNAYNSLITSGDIRFMDDFELKSRTIGLYEFYTWTATFEKIELDNYKISYLPYLKEHFDFVRNEVQAPEVYFDKVFINVLASYQYTLQNTLRRYRDCLAHMEEYLEEVTP